MMRKNLLLASVSGFVVALAVVGLGYLMLRGGPRLEKRDEPVVQMGIQKKAGPLTTRNQAAIRRIVRPPVSSTNGAIAAQINHHRGTLICAIPTHCAAASRVAESRSRVSRSSSR